MKIFQFLFLFFQLIINITKGRVVPRVKMLVTFFQFCAYIVSPIQNRTALSLFNYLFTTLISNPHSLKMKWFAHSMSALRNSAPLNYKKGMN